MAEYRFDVSDPASSELVSKGTIEVEGRLVDASNVTLFCTLELDGLKAHAVYKPIAGERSLWDFPDGTLAGREVATRLVSDAIGLANVPPTVLRDGPLGEGMVQLWVDTTDVELVDVYAEGEVPADWRVVLHAHDRLGNPAVLAHADERNVRDLAVLDIIVNNTDRKGGHVLAGTNERVYGVDHGLCLHAQPKLRTVLWGWVGEALPEDTIEKLKALRMDASGKLGAHLAEHLTVPEIQAMVERTELLLANGVFPEPTDSWRAIPWPLF